MERDSVVRSINRLVPVETTRLMIRKYTHDDVNNYYLYTKEKAMSQHMDCNPNRKRADAEWMINEIIAGYQNNTVARYAIEHTASGQMVGGLSVKFKEDNFANWICTLGYWVGVPHWGKGYATEALQGLRDLVTMIDGVHLVRLEVKTENAASLAVAHKAGFITNKIEYPIVELVYINNDLMSIAG